MIWFVTVSQRSVLRVCRALRRGGGRKQKVHRMRLLSKYLILCGQLQWEASGRHWYFCKTFFEGMVYFLVFDVLKAVSIEIKVDWNMTPYRSINSFRHLACVYSLPFHDVISQMALICNCYYEMSGMRENLRRFIRKPRKKEVI